jgi:Resolvase, N terminal domain
VFEEKISGKLKVADRPGLQAALEYMRSSDMLTIQEADRLGRNLVEGLIVPNDLFEQGVAVKILEGVAAGELTERSLILDLALALAEDHRRDIAHTTVTDSKPPHGTDAPAAGRGVSLAVVQRRGESRRDRCPAAVLTAKPSDQPYPPDFGGCYGGPVGIINAVGARAHRNHQRHHHRTRIGPGAVADIGDAYRLDRLLGQTPHARPSAPPTPLHATPYTATHVEEYADTHAHPIGQDLRNPRLCGLDTKRGTPAHRPHRRTVGRGTYSAAARPPGPRRRPRCTRRQLPTQHARLNDRLERLEPVGKAEQSSTPPSERKTGMTTDNATDPHSARNPADVLDPETGKVRILARPCATCIFRCDPMRLGAERTRQVIDHNLRAGALLTCHATLPYGDHPEFGPAVCAGFWVRHRNDVLAGRIAQQFLGIVHVDPKNLRTTQEP